MEPGGGPSTVADLSQRPETAGQTPWLTSGTRHVLVRIPRFPGVRVTCRGRAVDDGIDLRTRRVKVLRARLGCGAGCTTRRCSEPGRARLRPEWRMWSQASTGARP